MSTSLIILTIVAVIIIFGLATPIRRVVTKLTNTTEHVFGAAEVWAEAAEQVATIKADQWKLDATLDLKELQREANQQ